MTMCRASARQITNPCTSAQSYWSNNTIEPLSNNYETKHFRNCKQGIVTARRAYRSAGRRLRFWENSCTRRNDVTRSKLQISGRIMRTWRFLPRDASNHVSPSFIHIRPLFAVIPPGETQTVTIELNLDLSAKRLLEADKRRVGRNGRLPNRRGPRLLRSLHSHFLPTSFGASLATLVRRLQPGRFPRLSSPQLGARRRSMRPLLRSAVFLASCG